MLLNFAFFLAIFIILSWNGNDSFIPIATMYTNITKNAILSL